MNMLIALGPKFRPQDNVATEIAFRKLGRTIDKWQMLITFYETIIRKCVDRK